MITCRCMLVLALHLAAALAAFAQLPLPLVDDVDWRQFQARTTSLCAAMKERKMALPARTERAVRELESAKDRAHEIKEIQKALDSLCLVGITINPESRVKVARGSADPVLVKDRDVFVLIKVQNDAGVTSAVAVAGPQIVSKGGPADGRWLEAAMCPIRPGNAALDGTRLQYLILRLRARESGKREATLRFDVGQGTQDLGFRAEVPILFTVK